MASGRNLRYHSRNLESREISTTTAAEGENPVDAAELVNDTKLLNYMQRFSQHFLLVLDLAESRFPLDPDIWRAQRRKGWLDPHSDE